MAIAKPLGAVDFHTHVVPDAFPSEKGRDPRWPSIVFQSDGTAQVIISEKLFRRVDRRSWDPQSRLADMQARGIAHQVLSPMPELLSYWFSSSDGEAICVAVNRFITDLVAACPTRFSGFGMVPLQEPDRAVRMLPELREAGLSGVEIGTNIDGMPISDPSLAPFFSEAERLNLTVMVHAVHPAGTERIANLPGMAGAAVFPLETALAAVALMTSGVLERNPALRIMLSHGGGALPMILPRLDHAWRLGLPIAKSMSVLPSELARRFYYDSVVYGEATLRFLAETVGAERILAGSDYPFRVMEDDPAGFVARAVPRNAADKILFETPHTIVGDLQERLARFDAIHGAKI
jgi:aminocarboxymuconate-semialdehyde decarboxylase